MCLSLIPIGFRTSRAGIRGRPKFPFRERIVSDLADFGFSNLAYKSIDGFSLPKLDPLIPTVLHIDDDLVRNPHTSYTKFKRLLKRQWLFWESLRWFLFPWQNWTIWVGILTVSLLMASFASYGNDRFRHGYSTFSQSFWLGCGCVSRLSRGSVFWWDHQGGLTRDSRVRCRAKNVVVSGGLLRLLSEQDENDKTRCTQLAGEAWKHSNCIEFVLACCGYNGLRYIISFKKTHSSLTDLHGPFQGCASFVNIYSEICLGFSIYLMDPVFILEKPTLYRYK